MMREQMLDDLQHEQTQLLFWMEHAQRQGMGMYAPRMAWALANAATLQRSLNAQPAIMFDFLSTIQECDAAVHAYWDELHERDYRDRLRDAFLRTQAWLCELLRKGLVELDSEGIYDLTDAGRDYYNVDALRRRDGAVESR
jgi:hypothetical protein